MTTTTTAPSLALRQVLLLHTLRIFAASGCETLECGLNRSQSLLMPLDHLSDRGPLLGDFGEREISVLSGNFDVLQKTRHAVGWQLHSYASSTPCDNPSSRPQPAARELPPLFARQQHLATPDIHLMCPFQTLQVVFARSQSKLLGRDFSRTPYYPLKLVNSKQHYMRNRE